jgi:hypothetical protein
MRFLPLAILTAGLLSLAPLPCPAQEAKPPEPLPAPADLAPKPCLVPVTECKTTYKLHWLEREVPHTKMELKLREESAGQEHRIEYEIDWTEEKCLRTETTYKPREIVKDVTVCTSVPEKVCDPVTGCCKVILKPVTEVKQVREIVFEPVTEQKEYVLRRPCLKPVDRVFTLKKLCLDIVPKTENFIERFGVLAPVEITETKLVPAAPCCPDKGACPHK